MDIRISAIVPIYNIKSEYLKKCIQSLVDQKFDGLEIILVNDGSTQNSCDEICREFEQRDSRIHYIYQKNKGVSVARNVGISAATGDYILFVDADDWIENGLCEILCKEADAKKVDLLFFAYTTNYQNRELPRILTIPKKEMFKKEILQLAILKGDDRFGSVEVGTPWGKLIRRQIIQENRVAYVDGLKKGQDTVFVLNLLDYCENIIYLPYIGYHYRISGTSISKKFNPDIIPIMEATLSEYGKFIEKHKKDMRFRQALDLKYVHVILGEYMLLYFANANNPKRKEEKRQELLRLLDSKAYKDVIQNASPSGQGIWERVQLYVLKHRMGRTLRFIKICEGMLRDLLIHKYD